MVDSHKSYKYEFEFIGKFLGKDTTITMEEARITDEDLLALECN
jgi:hypothetical protein